MSGMFESESVCAVERLEHPQDEGFRLVEFQVGGWDSQCQWWVGRGKELEGFVLVAAKRV